jgi:hypothetical protein
MRKLHIRGLAGFAKYVRQELSEPVQPQRLAELKTQVEETVRAIEQILKEKHVRASDLPTPTKKALQFIKSLDLDAVAAQPPSAEGDHRPSLRPESVTFPGLVGHFNGLLDELAHVAEKGHSHECDCHLHPGELYEEIVSDTENIEEEIKTKDIRPEHLKKQYRDIRGWLAYFAQKENFDAYCAAVKRAEPAFRAASIWPAGPGVNVVVQFRPMHGMYRVRGYQDAIVVHLPTPMICFDKALLHSIAQMAFRRSHDKKASHEAAAGESYQQIAATLELLGGIVERTRGLHHDLADSFDRVNAAYFKGQMARPHLVWSRSFATRKLGHYERATDTVMVNILLDKKTVPQCAVDYIVYHELLHKHLGVKWKRSRMAAHTKEFTAMERQFLQYDEARAALHRLVAER